MCTIQLFWYLAISNFNDGGFNVYMYMYMYLTLFTFKLQGYSPFHQVATFAVLTL